MYEVEIKCPVADTTALRDRLAALGGRFATPREQADHYYAHPTRDFAATDEALRVRHDGDRLALTWKGPRIDSATKTRREIELPLAALDGGPAATVSSWDGLLAALGFRPVRVVRKRRTPVELRWQGAAVEVAIDEVEGVGTFVELEEMAAPDGVAAARDRLTSLSHDLGCGPAERRSYLELLLAADRRD